MILDGRFVATTITISQLKQRVKVMKIQGVSVGLGVILVGNKIESQTYVTMKERKCKDLESAVLLNDLEEHVTQEVIEQQICKFNRDKEINGI